MVRFRVDDAVAADDGAVVWPVYEAVFGDCSDYETWRGTVWDKHSVRNGFRLARAYDADLLVGFAYGYTGEYGQWWTDNALTVGKARPGCAGSVEAPAARRRPPSGSVRCVGESATVG